MKSFSDRVKNNKFSSVGGFRDPRPRGGASEEDNGHELDGGGVHVAGQHQRGAEACGGVPAERAAAAPPRAAALALPRLPQSRPAAGEPPPLAPLPPNISGNIILTAFHFYYRF